MFIFLLSVVCGISIDAQSYELQKPQQIPNNEMSLLGIAQQLEKYSFVSTYLDLENSDNQQKRIVIATLLSIILIVISCIVIQMVLNISKRCKIEMNAETD
ncbi:hypothetical protein pb186bvf_015371 [Paramecium bursaria]